MQGCTLQHMKLHGTVLITRDSLPGTMLTFSDGDMNEMYPLSYTSDNHITITGIHNSHHVSAGRHIIALGIDNGIANVSIDGQFLGVHTLPGDWRSVKYAVIGDILGLPRRYPLAMNIQWYDVNVQE